MGGLQLVLSKTNRIGGTKYSIQCMSEVMSNVNNAMPSCNMCSWGNQVSLVLLW